MVVLDCIPMFIDQWNNIFGHVGTDWMAGSLLKFSENPELPLTFKKCDILMLKGIVINI